MVRALDKADAMLTLSMQRSIISGAIYHLFYLLPCISAFKLFADVQIQIYYRNIDKRLRCVVNWATMPQVSLCILFMCFLLII